ncbi:MAG: chromosomal replication initiator protein DnaA [Lachnospiraceae bacterium]|nr:chromosomal replication initiator protein DnaA [Lachnospiraceae bacterium]
MEKLMNKWEEIKSSIQKEYSLSDISFKTWIQPLDIYEVKDDTITILIPSDKAQSINYISNKYYLPIKVSISEALKKECDIKFVLEKDIYNNSNISSSASSNNLLYENSKLEPKYNFDTFVVGNNNSLAHSAALAVAETPGEVYNPLFLYGGVGLGKTHLMHAIGNFIISNDPSAKVMYVPSEQFTNELIEAIRIGKNSPAAINKFREKYRNIDVLLIDDIQFIIGKESTQLEFFNTFEKLYQEKKQIVISSDKPPKDMYILEERLKSRFGWGLTIDIQSPDYETRVAILKKKKDLGGYNISDEVIEYVARNVNSNIRELEGSLNKLNAYYILGDKREITVEKAKDALKDIISPNTPNKITPQHIMDVVCEHLNIKPEEIKSKKRNEEIVRPRQIVMYLCNKYTDCSSTKIGEFLGKDHSTVLHGVTKLEADLENDSDLKNKVDIIIKKLNL